MTQVVLHSLDPDQAARYAALTFPAYRHLLDGRAQPRHREGDTRVVLPIALGARGEDGSPLGLALAERVPSAPTITLLSVFVVQPLRRVGLGRALIGGIEQIARAEGAQQIEATWMHGSAQGEMVPGLLAKCGFGAPESRMLSVRFDAAKMAEAEWLRRYPLRSEYSVFSWADLGDEERAKLQASQRDSGWIAPDLQPWDHDAMGFEPGTSVGLRYRGEVVGWIITHRLDADTVRYTCSFIRADLGRLGRILPLYGESFRRLRKFGFKRGMFTTPWRHAGMAAFAQRWMAPYSEFVGETRGARRELTDA